MRVLLSLLFLAPQLAWADSVDDVLDETYAWYEGGRKADDPRGRLAKELLSEFGTDARGVCVAITLLLAANEEKTAAKAMAALPADHPAWPTLLQELTPFAKPELRDKVLYEFPVHKAPPETAEAVYYARGIRFLKEEDSDAYRANMKAAYDIGKEISPKSAVFLQTHYRGKHRGDGEKNRDKWQQPDLVLKKMAIERGMTVADVGAGSGYFVPFLSKAVGRKGKVVAQDIKEAQTKKLQTLKLDDKLSNVVVVLGERDDPLLPPIGYDRILLVDVLHEVKSKQRFLAHLRSALAPDGQLVIIDRHSLGCFDRRKDHSAVESETLRQLETAGFRLLHQHRLPLQFLLILESNSPRP